MNLVDRLARAISEPAAREDGTRLTRRDLTKRGGLVVFSLGALAELGVPRLAAAALKPCPPLARCLADSNQAGSRAYQACLAKTRRTGPGKYEYDEFRDLDCRLWDGPQAAREAQHKCFANCKQPPKPPQPKRPSHSDTSKTQVPPPLPPSHVYDTAGLCANCESVGGECCFGGPGLLSPGGLCACATAGVECRRYGC